MLKMKKKIEIIAKYIINILTGIVVVSIFFALYGLFQISILNKSYASYLGYGLFEVESGSMEPTIKVKDMVIVKKTNEIKENDIITYEIDKNFITHRVVKVDKNKVITKGDSNNHEDKTIPKKSVVGKVVKICPKFGIWKKILLSPIVLIAIALTMLLFSVGFSYEDHRIKLGRKHKKQSSDEKLLNEKVEKDEESIVETEVTEETQSDEDNENKETSTAYEEEIQTEKENNQNFVKVIVKWNDDDNRDGLRPETVTLRLKKNNEIVSEKEVSEKDNWEYIFDNVTKDESYEIDQKDATGYAKSVENDTITNIHNPKKTNISGEIKWKDNNNESKKRPNMVKVKLIKEKEVIAEKEVSEKDKWKYTFINLYKYENGTEIKYKIDEEKVENYTKNINDNNITNKLNQ